MIRYGLGLEDNYLGDQEVRPGKLYLAIPKAVQQAATEEVSFVPPKSEFEKPSDNQPLRLFRGDVNGLIVFRLHYSPEDDESLEDVNQKDYFPTIYLKDVCHALGLKVENKTLVQYKLVDNLGCFDDLRDRFVFENGLCYIAIPKAVQQAATDEVPFAPPSNESDDFGAPPENQF